MLEFITVPIKSWLKKKEFEAKTTEVALAQLDEVTNLIREGSSIYAPKSDEDEDNWRLTGQVGAEFNSIINETKLSTSRDQSRKFFRYDPHGRAIIRSLCKFVIGRGVTFALKFDKEVPEAHFRTYQDHWNEFVKRESFYRKQKEFVRRYTRDGEIFLRFFIDSGGFVRIRFMEPERVDNPSSYAGGKLDGKILRGNLSYGIETSKKDIETVFNYYYLTSDDPNNKGMYIKIKADEVLHKKLYADSSCKRGFPYLEPLMYEIKAYNDWLRDRIILNKIRTAVGLVREIPPGTGPASAVQTIRDNTKAQKSGWESSRVQLMKPGTVLTARGVTYKFLSPELDARDSAEDGRNILLSIAAGAGLPEYMVTGDASNANYSSSMVAESPGVKEFEDLQDDLRDAFIEIFDRVMKAGVDAGILKKPIPKCDLVFPSLIARDIKKEADANVVYHQEKVLSLKTIRERIGANHEIENENIEVEANWLNTLPLPKLVQMQQDAQKASLKDPNKSKAPFGGSGKGNAKPGAGNSSPKKTRTKPGESEEVEIEEEGEE